mgnify:CR=1 FL=1
MAKANMGMTSSPTIVYEEIDNTPKLNIVTKQIWVDGEGWVLTKFYNIPNLVRISVVSPLERWCMDNLGEPKYLGKWFKVSQTIILDDKSYMLWLLMK